MSNDKAIQTYNVTVHEDVAQKLYIAFCGMPPARQEEIREDAKKRSISIQQATADNILVPKVAQYYEKGLEKQEEIMNSGLALVAQVKGITIAEAYKLLGLGEAS